jgi:hypothetical protein
MANLLRSAMFLAGISCKHIVFVLNVYCIPTIRKSTAFFKLFPFSISSVPFQVHNFNPILNMHEANCIFFGGLEFVGYFFAYVAHFVLWRDVWIRTQRQATNLATHLPYLATPLPS